MTTKWITHIRDADFVVFKNAAPSPNPEWCVGGKGSSICQSCGKEMPVCWDTVCAHCGGTFCYDCSVGVDGHWFCKRDRAKGVKEAPVLAEFLKGLK